MNKLHSQVTELLTAQYQNQVLDVVFTGSRFSVKEAPSSDYDFVIIMKDKKSVPELKEYCHKLAQYSKFPLDLIVTFSDAVFKTNPLLSYSALFNNIRLPELALTKLSLPVFDPFLLKTSQLKILAKNLEANSFKSSRHLMKAFSIYQIALSKETEVKDRLINCEYEKDYLHLSFGKSLKDNDFEMNNQLKNLIITELKNELDVINSQSANWEKYEMLTTGMDDVFIQCSKELKPIKDIYFKSISNLLDTASRAIL